MAANWTDFIRSPGKASRNLHVTSRDVARGSMIDELRAQEQLRRSMQGEAPAPHSPALSPQEIAALRLYEQRRRTEPPRAEGALGVLRQQLPQFFRDNQALADATGDLSLKEGALGLAGLVGGVAAPIAFGTGLTGAATGAGMSIAGDALMDEAARKILGESIQDPLSSGTFGALAGSTGKILKPLVAALGASSSDAEAMPFHSWMKFLKNARGELGDTALMVNPTASELTGIRKEAREFMPEYPTVRLMRRMKNGPDETFAWDGGKLLHKDVATHLNEPLSNFDGWPVFLDENLPSRFEALRALPIHKAGGGLIRKGLEKFGRRAARDEFDASTEAPLGALSVVKNKGGHVTNKQPHPDAQFRGIIDALSEALA